MIRGIRLSETNPEKCITALIKTVHKLDITEQCKEIYENLTNY